MPLPIKPARKVARVWAAFRLPAETNAEIARISRRRFYLNEDEKLSAANVIVEAVKLLSPAYPGDPREPELRIEKVVIRPKQKAKPMSASVRQPILKPSAKSL